MEKYLEDHPPEEFEKSIDIGDYSVKMNPDNLVEFDEQTAAMTFKCTKANRIDKDCQLVLKIAPINSYLFQEIDLKNEISSPQFLFPTKFQSFLTMDAANMITVSEYVELDIADYMQEKQQEVVLPIKTVEEMTRFGLALRNKMSGAKYEMAIKLGQKSGDETVTASNTGQKSCIMLDATIKKLVIEFVAQRQGEVNHGDIEISIFKIGTCFGSTGISSKKSSTDNLEERTGSIYAGVYSGSSNIRLFIIHYSDYNRRLAGKNGQRTSQ